MDRVRVLPLVDRYGSYSGAEQRHSQLPPATAPDEAIIGAGGA